MLTARKYLNRCSQLTNQLLDKVHLISLALIIPSGLAVYLGLVIERKLRISRYWKVIESTSSTPKKYSQARNQAFEGLVKAGVSLIDTDFKEINLSRAYLKSANLEHTNLEGAILECAHLERANLNRANLNSTNLSRFGHT